MTRRYPPTSITVGHAETELAEWHRRATAPHFVPTETVVPASEP